MRLGKHWDETPWVTVHGARTLLSGHAFKLRPGQWLLASLMVQGAVTCYHCSGLSGDGWSQEVGQYLHEWALGEPG